jgi:DNA-binding Lrp family transcriptional regulator
VLSAIVLINCHFPFEKEILEKLHSLTEIRNIYRTQGIYDLIVKIASSSEEEFKRTMIEIGKLRRVNSTVALIIKKEVLYDSPTGGDRSEFP